MLYVVRYQMKDSSTERVMATYPRHRAYLDEVAKEGEILLIGPLLPAPGNGSMAVFRSREAAQAFPAGDPFVLEGLAGPLPIQEWDALEYLWVDRPCVREQSDEQRPRSDCSALLLSPNAVVSRAGDLRRTAGRLERRPRTGDVTTGRSESG